jgi:regulator of CtrA degradation
MQVIAWLMTQRALAAGEIGRDQAAAPERRLGEAPASDAELLPRLPEPAAALIRASQDLYDRIGRIDDGVVPEAQPSPARSLLSRLQRSL